MKSSDVLQDLNRCLRCLGACYTCSVEHRPYEDAMFFFQKDGVLYMNGQRTGIHASQISAVRCRRSMDFPLGQLVIYYHSEDSDLLRLSIHLNQNSCIARLQLHLERHTQETIEGYHCVMEYLRAAASPKTAHPEK